jgi:hypothetical protein
VVTATKAASVHQERREQGVSAAVDAISGGSIMAATITSHPPRRAAIAAGPGPCPEPSTSSWVVCPTPAPRASHAAAATAASAAATGIA